MLFQEAIMKICSWWASTYLFPCVTSVRQVKFFMVTQDNILCPGSSFSSWCKAQICCGTFWPLIFKSGHNLGLKKEISFVLEALKWDTHMHPETLQVQGSPCYWIQPGNGSSPWELPIRICFPLGNFVTYAECWTVLSRTSAIAKINAHL